MHALKFLSWTLMTILTACEQSSSPSNIYWIYGYSGDNCDQVCQLRNPNSKCDAAYFSTITTLDAFYSMYNNATDVITCLPVGQSIDSLVRKSAISYCDGGINFVRNNNFNTDPSSYTFQSIVFGTENNDEPEYVASRRCGFPISVDKATGNCGTGSNNFYYMRRFCACDAPITGLCNPTSNPTLRPTEAPTEKPIVKYTSNPSS
jgi:hypothetical protein